MKAFLMNPLQNSETKSSVTVMAQKNIFFLINAKLPIHTTFKGKSSFSGRGSAKTHAETLPQSSNIMQSEGV